MAFSIKLLNQKAEKSNHLNEEMYGEIVVGDFRERFVSSVGYWSREEYIRQWAEAIKNLINGPGTSSTGLISNMNDPASANFINCWALYRDENKVYIQNKILFLNELSAPFNPAQINIYVGERQTVNAQGDEISEWCVDVSDLEAYLKTITNHP